MTYIRKSVQQAKKLVGCKVMGGSEWVPVYAGRGWGCQKLVLLPAGAEAPNDQLVLGWFWEGLVLPKWSCLLSPPPLPVLNWVNWQGEKQLGKWR